MEKLQVNISNDLMKNLEHSVSSGVYSSYDEAIGEAVGLLFENADNEKAKLNYLRNAVQESIDDVNASIPAEEVFAGLRQSLKH